MFDTAITILIDQALSPLISLAAAALVAWATAKFHQFTGIQIEAKHREALQSALENGARYAINLLRQRGEPITLERAAELGAQYVRNSVPDALGYFKVGDLSLRDLLIPKVNLPTYTEAEVRDLTGYTGTIENRAR